MCRSFSQPTLQDVWEEQCGNPFLLPVDEMLVHCRVTPQYLICWCPFITLGKRGTEIISVLPKNTTQCEWPGLKPILFDLESRALTMRLLCLQQTSRHADTSIVAVVHSVGDRRKIRGPIPLPSCFNIGFNPQLHSIHPQLQLHHSKLSR